MTDFGALVPVATPGHTTGHTAYFLEAEGIVFSGDALVTGHPLLRDQGRLQLLPDFFSEDEPTMLKSLETIGRLSAETLIPGHGPVHRGPFSGRLK